LGRFDPSLAQEIRKLNPELTDLNHIEAGEQIRLPRVADSVGEPHQVTETADGGHAK
jgi:hypothetical protein